MYGRIPRMHVRPRMFQERICTAALHEIWRGPSSRPAPLFVSATKSGYQSECTTGSKKAAVSSEGSGYFVMEDGSGVVVRQSGVERSPERGARRHSTTLAKSLALSLHHIKQCAGAKVAQDVIDILRDDDFDISVFVDLVRDVGDCEQLKTEWCEDAFANFRFKGISSSTSRGN